MKLTTVGRALVLRNRACPSIRLCLFFIFAMSVGKSRCVLQARDLTHFLLFPRNPISAPRCHSSSPSLSSQSFILIFLLLQPFLLPPLDLESALLSWVAGRGLAERAEKATKETLVAFLLVLH